MPCDVKLSLIVLDEKLVDQGRTSIKVYQADPEEDEETTFVLANLIPGKVRSFRLLYILYRGCCANRMCRQIEAQTVDLIISEDEDISIEVTGKKSVPCRVDFEPESSQLVLVLLSALCTYLETTSVSSARDRGLFHPG